MLYIAFVFPRLHSSYTQYNYSNLLYCEIKDDNLTFLTDIFVNLLFYLPATEKSSTEIKYFWHHGKSMVTVQSKKLSWKGNKQIQLLVHVWNNDKAMVKVKTNRKRNQSIIAYSSNIFPLIFYNYSYRFYCIESEYGRLKVLLCFQSIL